MDDGFTVDTDSDGDMTLAYVQTLLRRAECHRRTDGDEYERHAKRLDSGILGENLCRGYVADPAPTYVAAERRRHVEQPDVATGIALHVAIGRQRALVTVVLGMLRGQSEIDETYAPMCIKADILQRQIQVADGVHVQVADRATQFVCKEGSTETRSERGVRTRVC